MIKVIRAFYSFVLARKYRVRIIGHELLKAPGGKIVMPNHQSYIEPQLIILETFKYNDIVPVANKSFFKVPVISFFLRKWDAIPVSKLKDRKKGPERLGRVADSIRRALSDEKSVILFPAGQLQSLGMEQVGSKKAAFEVVRKLEDETVKVLGVRVRGLLGSSFSRAATGERPKFFPAYGKGMLIYLANLIFLNPKRDVTFEIVDLTAELKNVSEDGLIAFNEYLDKFYNKHGVEEVNFGQHFFFLPKSKRKLHKSILEEYKRLGL